MRYRILQPYSPTILLNEQLNVIQSLCDLISIAGIGYLFPVSFDS